MEADVRAIEFQRLAVLNRLYPACEILAIAQTHDVERFLRRQHGAVSRSSMVGVAVRDQGLLDRPGWVDMEAAGHAAHARGGGNEDIFGTHRG